MAKKPPTAAQLRSLSTFIDKQVALERDIADKQSELAKLAERHKKLVEVDIPGLFDQLGLSEIALNDGRKVVIDAKVYASITEDNKEAAFAWMRANNLGGLIKTTIAAEFGKDSNELATKVWLAVQKLVKDKAKLTAKEAVHPSTLSATVRDILKEGRLALPDSITTADVKKSTIKLPK